MNDVCEMWSSPWRALQRDLALGLSEQGHALPPSSVRGVNVQSKSVAANSWLGRARAAGDRHPARQ